MEYLYLTVAVLFFILLLGRSKSSFILYNQIKKKKQGKVMKMPKEFIKSFIGKDVVISLFNETMGIQGVLLEIEENWIKVETKKETIIINGDMIRDISTKKEQNKK